MKFFNDDEITYSANGQSSVVKPESIDPRFIGNIAENDTANCVCNTNDRQKETGVSRFNSYIQGLILAKSRRKLMKSFPSGLDSNPTYFDVNVRHIETDTCAEI